MNNIKIKGTRNVRDLKEILEEHNIVLKNHLLRGASLYKLKKKGAETLKDEYKINMIIDLRTSGEVKEKPDKKIDGIEYVRLPIFDEAIQGLSHENKDKKIKRKDTIPNLVELYRNILTGECMENIKNAFKFIIDNLKTHNIFLHCTEGKDRTGIIAALFLLMLEVDKDIILDDYLYTNKVNNRRSIKYYWLVRIFYMSKKLATRLRNIFLAKEEYIDELFKQVDKYNNVDEYFSHEMNLSKDEVNKYKKALLA